MTLPILRLKKTEDRRIRSGHRWIYSNEIDVAKTPLKTIEPGQLVCVTAHDQTPLGIAYANPKSLIAARLLTQEMDTEINVDFFIKRITEALSLREQLFAKPFYRLVFSEGDQLPGLVLDRFQDHIVMQANTYGMEKLTPLVIDAIKQVLPSVQSILLRNDSGAREQEGLSVEVKPAFGEAPHEVLLEENGVSFYAPLWKGQKTGWFYDHRMNRARLKNYVAGKRVLDVFSYLGGFGIEAAAFGASDVTCIDASKFACDAIHKNAHLNHVDKKVTVICDDAFDALKALLAAKKEFDVIILDPPAFVKKAKDRKEGLLAYQRLNELALKLLAKNGILVSCSCSMHVSLDDLTELLRRAQFRTQTTLQFLEYGHQGPDHPLQPFIPETNYLKAIFARKLEK